MPFRKSKPRLTLRRCLAGPAALFRLALSPKTLLMRCALHQQLRRIASTLMLAAVLAFAAQGAMVLVSQVAAANGSMPDPAVTVSGSLHYHDPLARHFHVHH